MTSHDRYKELLAPGALDLLSEAERAEFAAHVATCDECQAELQELRDAAATLAYAVAPFAPPAELRARLLEGVRLQPNLSLAKPPRGVERDGASEAPSNVVPLPLKTRRDTQAFISRRFALASGALAAAVIVALIIPLALLWRRNNELRAELARQAEVLQATRTELARASERLRETQAELTGGREREQPTATPEAGGVSALPPAADESAPIARPPNRDDERRAEIVRLSNRNNELQAEVARVSARNNELQAELARVSRGYDEAQTQLAALADRNAELQRELTRLTSLNAELQTQIASFSNRNRELQAEVARLSKSYSDLQSEAARRSAEPLLASPDASVVALEGTKAARAARANLIYDRRTGGITLFAHDLPPAPPGKTYQLWLIAGGKPVSGGLFTTDQSGRATLRGQASAGGRQPSAFAVTLEPSGGTTKPTGDKYLLGSL